MQRLKALASSVRAFFVSHPASVKFLRDCVEGALTAVAALTLTIPTTLSDARSQGLIVAAAVIGAVIAIARRSLRPVISEVIAE